MDSILAVIPATMILAIPLLAIWTGHRRKVLAMQNRLHSGELAKKVEKLLAQNEELEARVQALETIATLDERPRHSSRVRIGSEDTLAFDVNEERAKTA